MDGYIDLLKKGPGKVTIDYKSYLSSLPRILASIQEASIQETITAVQRKGMVSSTSMQTNTATLDTTFLSL